jgi:lysophospholipase L1-like esterase
MEMQPGRIIKRIITGFLALTLFVELAIRLSGVVDFPVYHVDDAIGYVIRPNQTGAFLHTHSWVFNDRSMGTAAAWDPTKKPNLLLIGNSIVMGGNPYAQPEKLGPLLQSQLGDGIAVWSIAIGGWTEVNETVYLERNPDVASAAGFFVWVVLGGGLSQLTKWPGDYVFPRERPLSATWYVLRRYAIPRLMAFNVNELPPQGALTTENLNRFEAMVAKLSQASGRPLPGVLVFYPREADLAQALRGNEWLAERPELERIASKYGVRILDISKQHQWTSAQYRDGTHPTVEGNRLLAQIIADAVSETYRP